MNTLEECRHGIWGSEDARAALAQAKSARLLLVADTHERLPVLRGILRDYGPRCDALIFAGDGLADFVEYREEAIADGQACAFLPPVIFLVAGNGDLPAYRVTSEKDPSECVFFRIPPIQTADICRQKVLITHGHLHSINFSTEPVVNAARHNGCSVVVYGHTHIPAENRYQSIFAVNPGSICLPRGDSLPSFAILTLYAPESKTPPHCEFKQPGTGVPALKRHTRRR